MSNNIHVQGFINAVFYLGECKMPEKAIFSSEYIRIIKRQDGFYIESLRRGMTLEQFNRLMSDHPEIKVTNVMAIRNAILYAPRPAEKFGEVKARINIELSDDQLKAYLTLCVEEEEISGPGKADLIREILKKLNEKGVVFGVKNSVLLGRLVNHRQILIAEGIAPVSGEDSVVRMYEMKDVKPEVKEDGNVDHYELNLINRVNAGDWLGERIDPKEGTPGRTVRGSTLLPAKGKSYPLFYDRNTVREVYDNGKTTLYAAINGAVHYDGDRISVSNHLEITNNVDFKTGNIDFDGFLTVKGSIEDSFSVAASKDIEILGDFGLGSVKDIVSNEGSIYIKGGIAGKNKAVIRSKKDIYTKFVSDTTIICDGSVHIGFYCLNSSIKAKEVILDSPKGQIIGGTIQADIRVVASTIGSSGEKRTYICVSGFDRNMLKSNLEKLAVDIERAKSELARAKQEISVYSSISALTREQAAVYERIKDRFFEVKDRLKRLEEERRALTGYLRVHGEGEVSVLKRIHPNSVLEIKKIIKEIYKPVMSTCFYVQDGELKEL